MEGADLDFVKLGLVLLGGERAFSSSGGSESFLFFLLSGVLPLVICLRVPTPGILLIRATERWEKNTGKITGLL
jgi:hypothetical protein